MRRLDEIVRELLQGVSERMEKAGGTAGEAAPPLARDTGGGGTRARNSDRHPITSTRRMAKKATGDAAKRSMPR